MIYEVMKHVRNFFVMPKGVHEGFFLVKDGVISLSGITEGQYFLIEGSVFNDGVHQYPTDKLKDEKFEGAVMYLAVPEAFLELSKEIEEYQSKNGNAAFTSETFGNYSYSKATGSDGLAASWQDVFKDRLNVWRKV